MGTVDWAKIKSEYLSGKQPKEICKKYPSLNYKTLSTRVTRENWNQLKKDAEKEIEGKVKERVSSEEADAILQMKAEERDKFPMFERVIMRSISKKTQSGAYELRDDIDSQDVNNFMNAMKKLHEMKYKNYGVPDKHIVGNDPENPFGNVDIQAVKEQLRKKLLGE